MTIEELIKNFSPKEYKKGEKIYFAGDKPQGIYYLKRGLVGLTLSSEKGNELLVRLFKPENFFGHRSYFAMDNYHATSIAIENSLVYYVPSHHVQDLIQNNPACVQRFLHLMAVELKQAEQKVLSLSEKDVPSRVAEAIIYLKDIHPQHNWTRQQIAEFCGSTTSTVIKILARFEEAGLIQQEGREIKIVSKEKLLSLENFDV